MRASSRMAGTTEKRFTREIIFGARRGLRYCQLTTDPKTQPIEVIEGMREVAHQLNRSLNGEIV